MTRHHRHRRFGYSNPVPRGRVGRTDQGVDVSAPPGSGVYAIADEQEVGIIRNWYKGQPLVWFHILGTNTYDYVAEQFSPSGRIGQVFRKGQRIGTVAPSGTGLELGWATRSGRTLAQATTGYTEGQATPAGQDFRRRVFQGGGGAPGSSRLADLWIQAGGDPKVANIMAAIGLAESGGRNIKQSGQSAANTGWGIWQITPGNPSLLDPMTNARAAVAKYKSQGLSAWTTYTSGAYRSFLGQAGSATVGGVVRPGGDPASQSGDATPIFAQYDAELEGWNDQGGPQYVGLFGDPLPFDPLHLGGFNPLDLFGTIKSSITDVQSFLQVIAWILHPRNILRAVEFLTGIGILVFGLQATMQMLGERKEGFDTSEGALSRSGLGRVSKELASAAVTRRAPSRPEAAPHTTRRTALRVRYERERKVSDRNRIERRNG